MSTIDFNKRIEIRLYALSDVQTEHADLWDAWKVVESKAQPIAAVSGIFLAGVFAYLGQLPAGATLIERCLLLSIAVLLIASVILALRAIWVADVASPHTSGSGINEADDVIHASTTDIELDERQDRMLQAAYKRWARACADIRVGLQGKQRLLSGCIWLLCAAAVLSLPLVYWTLFERVIEKT